MRWRGCPLRLGACVREHRLRLATLSVWAEPHRRPRTGIQQLCLLDMWAQPRRKRPRQRLRGLPSGARQKVASPALCLWLGVA